jgi:hypothetical protein
VEKEELQVKLVLLEQQVRQDQEDQEDQVDQQAKSVCLETKGLLDHLDYLGSKDRKENVVQRVQQVQQEAQDRMGHLVYKGRVGLQEKEVQQDQLANKVLRDLVDQQDPLDLLEKLETPVIQGSKEHRVHVDPLVQEVTKA